MGHSNSGNSSECMAQFMARILFETANDDNEFAGFKPSL